MKRNFVTTAIAVAAVGSLVLAGCGTDSDDSQAADGLTPLSFQLNWPGGGPNAGFAVAQAEGFYREAGLDVTIVEGTGSGPTVQLVASGREQIGFADASVVSQLIAEGAPLKVVATINQATPNTVTSLRSAQINTIADLKGRKVGLPQGQSQSAMVPLLLEPNGLAESDLEIVNVPPTSLVPVLLQGQVEAIMGGVDSTSVQLEREGSDIRDLIWADNGVSTVAQSIFASQRYLDENPDLVKAFVAASLKGWVAALDDPQLAATASKEVFPTSVAETALAEFNGISQLFCAGDAKFIGKAEPAHWENTQSLLARAALLPEGQDPTDYYTYDYLPDESEMRSCS